jgi:hypothetical protein
MDAESTGETLARQSQTRRIFFSYARADSEFVLKLAKDLRAAGKNLWLDQLDIEPGDPWDQSVEGALKTSPELLVVLSPASVASANVMDEVSFALEERKRVVPILYRKCDIPFRLKRLQYIDLTADYRSGFETLLRVLVKDQIAPKPPPKDPVAPKPPPKQLTWIKVAAIAATFFIVVVGGVGYLVERQRVVLTPMGPIYCTSTGQTCVPVFSTPLTLNQSGPLTIKVTAPATHCSNISYIVSVDGSVVTKTPFLGPGQNSIPINTAAVTTGKHTITVQGVGTLGGCNSGNLLSWAGTLTITHRGQFHLS